VNGSEEQLKRTEEALEKVNRQRNDLLRWIAEDEERIAHLQMRLPRLKQALAVFDQEFQAYTNLAAAFSEHARQAASRPTV
jgi:chromosome segregation ATPase